MSYYDPRIYNFANLDESDKQIVSCTMELTRDSLFESYFDNQIQTKHENALTKVVSDIRKEALEDAWDKYLCAIIDLMAAIIDGYDRDVPMQDTEDYYFGCEIDDLFDDEDTDEGTI